MAVQVNQPAPGFELSAVVGTTFQKVKLSDYNGTWIVLFFYPLDFTKQVSKDYGVLLERLGAALRGTFFIDPDGLLRAYSVQDLTEGRNADEILRLVYALKTLELCPVGWRPGEAHLPSLPKNTYE